MGSVPPSLVPNGLFNRVRDQKQKIEKKEVYLARNFKRVLTFFEEKLDEIPNRNSYNPSLRPG